MNKKIIIAGGGTGGHIFPAIATAQALSMLDKTISILFVGAKNKMEMEKVPQAGFKIEGLDIAGYNRSSLIKNISVPFKLIKSFLQAYQIIKKFSPHVVVGVGGYASFPMLWLAQLKNIPTILLEQNSVAGKANRMLGKRANAICVAYEGMNKYFVDKKIIFTGNPVRHSISLSAISRLDALKFFELDENKKTILVIGGSQGAHSINEAVNKNLNVLLQEEIQLIWQTGNLYLSKAKASASGKKEIFVSEFITNMENAYASADVVVSRAGAIAIAELCVVKKPVIFVPFPLAAEDHQTANALQLVSKNAALIINDNEVNQKLVSTAVTLINNEEKQNELIKNIERMAISNADEIIANEILKLIK